MVENEAIQKMMLFFAFLAACISARSCEWCTVRGKIADAGGEALPGVSVAVENGEAQALSDALGVYTLRHKPHAALHLRFTKTGYAPGKLALEAAGPRTVSAPDVTLWRLPPTGGVFFFGNNRYRPASPVEPRPFSRDKEHIVFGVASLPPLEETLDREPMLFTFKTPPFDARICTICPGQIVSTQSDAPPQEIWTAGISTPAGLQPVDQPEHELLQVRLREPLEPGIYAIHWGALEGYASGDPRAFLFRVISTEEAEGPKTEPAPAPEDEAKKEPRPAAPPAPENAEGEEIDTESVDAEGGPADE